MKITPERKLEINYHPYAECVICTWSAPSGADARNQAKDHVRKFGHDVRVVSETVATWGPKTRVEEKT